MPQGKFSPLLLVYFFFILVLILLTSVNNRNVHDIDNGKILIPYGLYFKRIHDDEIMIKKDYIESDLRIPIVA